MATFTDVGQTFPESGTGHGPSWPDRPWIERQVWGYEVVPAEAERGALALARAILTLLAMACVLAAAGVWLIPAEAWGGPGLLPRLGLSAALGGAAAALHAQAVTRRAVRLQVDTARGELREVADSGIGRAHVLGVYGFDAVTDVELHGAGQRGQIRVQLSCGDVLPAGTGDPAVLEPFRARLVHAIGRSGAA
ncbi:hypothetical protein [Salibaculum halophilum]|uniref:hypothetical protein n=1 Tax=Salibaculum halophilum TaxID=1914408 RepID=UPI000A1209D2|nr:hypothetical protein [Salibaculum halophilum]